MQVMKQKIAWLGASNMDFHIELIEAHGQLEYSLVQSIMHSHAISLAHLIF
jgi:hypothetical protein